MIGLASTPAPVASEFLDPRPGLAVADEEYRRLLGYPNGHVPGARARELMAWARSTFEQVSRPWVYEREAELEWRGEALHLDGRPFALARLAEHLRQTGARRVVLLAVSAGRGAEERARQLWEEGRPDEYYFLEMYASAVVEHLVAASNARRCALAEAAGLMAVPHYSPGYTGWDVADQRPLFDLVLGDRLDRLPEALDVLSSGMLRPKKSLLAVIGLAPATERSHPGTRAVACESCAHQPCQYRRVRYRHAPEDAEQRPPAPAPASPRYRVNARALRRWATERVRLEHAPDGSVIARFRFDGTTCSNMGRPLAFDYEVHLGPPQTGRVINQAVCRPAATDDGHRQMCAYLADADGLRAAVEAERPLLGRPLDAALEWERAAAPAGCLCTADSRAHKWGLAYEAIHYALAQQAAARAAPSS